MGKKSAKRVRIGVVDTMFARYDMGAAARDELSRCPGYGDTFEIVARTVPGFKDLAVAAKVLIETQRHRGGARHARLGAHRQTVRPRGLHRPDDGPTHDLDPDPRGLRPRGRDRRPRRTSHPLREPFAGPRAQRLL